MTVQIKTAIAGLVIGVFLGLLGGIIGGIPILVLLFRSLVSGIAGALLLLLIYTLAKKFLPELVATESGDTSDGPDALAYGSEGSPRVNVTVEGDSAESLYGSDQASGLRAMRESRYNDQQSYDEDDDQAGGGIVEEVQEQMVGGSESDTGASFNEEAFYAGIDQLPDIGGFTESFSTGKSGTDDGGDTGPSTYDSPSVGSSSSKSKYKGAVDPQLMAQAIRSALKKDQ